jgi:hypothetical protein
MVDVTACAICGTLGNLATVNKDVKLLHTQPMAGCNWHSRASKAAVHPRFRHLTVPLLGIPSSVRGTSGDLAYSGLTSDAVFVPAVRCDRASLHSRLRWLV